MAFPNLTVRAQLDAAGITRGVQNAVRELARLNQTARATSVDLLPNAEQVGARAARDLIAGLQETFRQRQAETRAALFAGLINRAEARRQGQQAGIELTRGIQAAMAELNRRGLLTPQLQAELVRQMRGAAIPAGRATAEEIAKGIEDASPAVARALEESLTQGLRAARARAVVEAGVLMQDIGRTLQTAGRNLSLFVTAPIVAAGGLSIRAAAQLERLELGLGAITGSAEETARQLAELEQVAELPGIGFREAIEGATALQVLNFSAETATRTLRAFGNAIALTGGGAAELDRVIAQLTQMASAGRILTQDLRPIIQTAPAVGRALQTAFGTVNAQEIESLGLTFDEFLEQLLSGLEDLPPAAVGVAEGFERMRDDILLAQGAIGEQMIPAVLDLQRLVEGLSETIRGLEPETIRWGIAIAGAVALVGPAAAAVGTLTLAAGGLAKVLGTSLIGVLAGGGGVTLLLTAFAAAIFQARLEMAEARRQAEEYNRSLRSLSLEEAQDRLTETRRRARELREELEGLQPTRQIQTDVGISLVEDPRFAEISRELALTEEQVRTLIDRIGELTFAEQEAADTGTQMAEELVGAFERLSSIIRESDLLSEFGAFDLGDLPADIRDSFRESESLRGRLRSVESAIQAVVEAGGQVPQAATERVRQLQRAIEETDDELQALVSRLGFEGPQIAELAFTIGGVVIENPDEVRRRYEERVRQAISEEAVRSQLNLELVPEVSFAERRGVTARSEAVQRAREATEAFNENIEAGREVLSAFGDLADITGGLSDGLAQALRGIETFALGVQRIRLGQALQEQGQGLLGGLSVVSGVFSAFAGGVAIFNALNAAGRERERAERAAILSLQRFRLELDGFDPGNAAVLTQAGQAIDALRSLSFLDLTFLIGQADGLSNLIGQFGLSLHELLAIADSLDVQLIDEDGRILHENFTILAQRIEDARQALTRFRDTLDDQRRLLEAERTIRGIDVTPEVRIQGEIDLLERFAPELVRAFGLDQIDLTIPGEVERIRGIIIGIFEAIRDGTIPPELLAALPEGVRTLLEIILNIGSALNELDREVRDVATSLRNVPEVFNFSLQSLRAAGVRDFTGVNAPINPQTPDFGAPPHTEPRTSGPTFSINVEDGAIRIDARTESEDLTDAIVRAVVEAIGRSGRTLTPSDIEQIRRDLKPSLERAAGSLGTRSRDLARDWPG